MKSISELPLNINPQSPIPIHVQLKEQIPCLIGSDKLKPEQFLPSANELAEQLSLNRNTVNAVYNQLSKEGIVLSKKGSGTQIVDGGLLTKERELNAWVRRNIKEAADQQLNLSEMPVAYLIFAQIHEIIAEKSKHVLFVTFREEDYDTHIDEIQSIKTSTITRIAYERLQELERPDYDLLLQSVDILVTPYSGLKEINSLDIPASKRIIAVGDIPY